ncbi:MAG: HK97 gp10 family phage protein [Clostridium sp.]|nr:HK97 gp10 family phage protein [Clostridium sp.]
MPKNFEQYYAKMRNIEDVVPSIFEKVAKKSGIKIVNEAKDKTDQEKLVDTGAYKRAWHADIGEIKQKFWVVRCLNSMDYASHLEFGHKLKNGKRWKGRFVGKYALEKTLEFAHKELEKELGSLYKKD